jgi:Stress responsive A/B Barrel Domain
MNAIRIALLCTVALLATACRARGAHPTVAATGESVRHVVVFKFRPEATPAQVDTLTRAFAALKDSIPGIVSFEHGVNNSPENANLGFTHVYMLTFTSAAARDAYLVHPAHKRFGATLGRLGIWAGGFVVDWVPRS